MAGPDLILPFMIASTVISAAGQVQAGEAAAAAGEAQQVALNYQAEQARVQAGQERAAAQRAMLDERRKERLVQSALIARAAASGAGASDPTVQDLSGDIAEEGEFRALTALYMGEERARALEAGANLREFEGSQARQAGRLARSNAQFAAFGTLLGGTGQTLYQKYGLGGPASSGSDFAGGTLAARRAGAYG